MKNMSSRTAHDKLHFFWCTIILLTAISFGSTLLAGQNGTSKLSKAEVMQKTQRLRIPFIVNEGQTDEKVAFYANTFGGTVFVTKDGNIVYSLPHTVAHASPLVHYDIDKNETGYTGLTGYRGKEGQCIVHRALCTMYPYCIWYFPVYYSETNSPVCHSERSEESYLNNSQSAIPNPKSAIQNLSSTSIGDLKSGVAIKETLVGGRVQEITGNEKAVTKVSYFKGNDKSQWKTNISTYEAVSLGEVYDGIELKLKAYGNNVEKLFCVKPGADPDQIKIKLSGVKNPKSESRIPKLSVNERGELEVETELGPVKFTKPIAYQEINGKRVEVDVEYSIQESEVRRQTLENRNKKSEPNPKSKIANRKLEYGFTVASYDKSHDLIIDPLRASTYLGGSGAGVDCGYSLTLDTSGNVYVTGKTYSTDFPTTSGAYDTSYNGGTNSADVFVSKLDGGLTNLLASTYLGGAEHNYDRGYSLALDTSGNVYVTGKTSSTDFPTTSGAYDTSKNGGYDVFVSKMDGGLTRLLASTFLGGSDDDWCYSLTLDTSGNVYVTGFTGSTDFPTMSGAYDTSKNGGYDVFVSKLDGGLTSLLASTYLGGSSSDYGSSLTLDTSGNVYVTGWTYSTDFPTTSGAYDTSMTNVNYNRDVFVSKLDGGLTNLLASTYLGGSDNDSYSAADEGYSLTLDTSGNVYVTGHTSSRDFPTTVGAYDTSRNGGYDVFISKLDGGLTNLLASTYLGGSSDDQGYSLALDTSGNVYVTGKTSSTDFPTTSGAYDTSPNGGSYSYDVFVSKLDGNLSASAATTPTPSPTPSPTSSPKATPSPTPTSTATAVPTPTPSPTTTPEEEDLLKKHAPILYMHPDERFYPTNAQTMLDNSELIQKRQFSTITVYKNKNNTLTLDMLMSDKYNTKKHYLKLKEKSLNKIKNKNYWREKEKVVYGRQFKANDNGIEKIVLQYWFFYIYNDWGKKTDLANVHEGDWEMIQIILGSDKQPLLITYSYHEGGETFLWVKDKDEIDKSNDGNHPNVYVTLGGHGSWNKAGNHTWYQKLYGICYSNGNK